MQSDKRLIAFIQETNLASQKIFKNCGFIFDKEQEIQGEKYLVFIKE